jgi:ABC-type transport system involved in cytochrome c biogenesis permease subunit
MKLSTRLKLCNITEIVVYVTLICAVVSLSAEWFFGVDTSIVNRWISSIMTCAFVVHFLESEYAISELMAERGHEDD